MTYPRPARRDIAARGAFGAHDGRKNRLDRRQHVLGVNDPLVGDLGPFNEAIDNPHTADSTTTSAKTNALPRVWDTGNDSLS